jgi:L-cysteine S-thiosulfotransferase
MKRWLAPLLCLIPLVAGAMTLRSGHDDSSAETRAMQDDDDANPGFLWVKQGESLWAQADGTSGKSCASCHGGADTALSGAAARYPAFDAARRRVVTLEQRINMCRTDHMGAQPLAWDDDRLLALTALVGLRSRGLPLTVTPVEPAYSLGERLFRQRMGQLNLSCAQCHDERAGMRLGGALIPQGHPNGYPLYRLEWQGMGSLYRRLRNCMIGVRSEPFPPDGAEATALSLFLAVRAKGLRVETPAVRP